MEEPAEGEVETLLRELDHIRHALAAARAEAAVMRPVFDALLRENQKIINLLRGQSEMLAAGALQTAFPTVYGGGRA